MPTYVAIFALVLSYVALVAAYFALRTLAKLRRASAVLERGARGSGRRASLLEAVERQAALGEATRTELAELRQLVTTTREDNRTALDTLAQEATRTAQEPGEGLRNVALVRYDAFDGSAGRLSFSLALLDDAGDGVTISALAGQADTRVYAKAVTAGRASDGAPELSPEERQAVTAALSGAPKRGRTSRRAS